MSDGSVKVKISGCEYKVSGDRLKAALEYWGELTPVRCYTKYIHVACAIPARYSGIFSEMSWVVVSLV